MSAETRKVDVLAVMRQLRERFINLREVAGFGESELTAKADEAIAAVADLIEAATSLNSNAHLDLGDQVYQVREREGLGWEGPAVKQWSDAVTKLRNALGRIA